MATYKESGVDIAAGEATVDKIKPLVRETYTPGVMTDIGLFGAMFDASFPDYDHPVLVSSVDGVGTKLKVAVLSDRHTTVGQDLVNHCVGDILVCGAKPLYFMDYFATGKLNPDVAADVISGFATACKQNGCALIGGETAEMPSMYADGEYDLAGTIVGVVEKARRIDGAKVKEGDILLGLESSGLHTNGYSLARHVLLKGHSVNDHIDELGETIADALLKIHRSYLHIIMPLLNKDLINGLSHITGGGIVGNTKRVVRDLGFEINWNSWPEPRIFDMIRRLGNVPEEDMREAFNLGIGMIMIVDPANVDAVKLAIDEPVYEMGRVVGK